ncbi:MAG: AAA family ATPase [Acidobacteriota bacterium]
MVAEFREDIESGSTSDSLDPEHLSEILPRFQRLVHRAAECFDAFLVDLSGHRAVLSTGYPQAQEDAAARAASAALEITTGWRRIRADLEPGRGGDLEVHGGIHTGSAVVLLADGDRHERLVLGRTLDVAIFVRKKAPAGLILLSDTARQVVARHREILLTAFQATSATDEPELFQLNGIAENRPFESTRHRPIRGRDRELGFLEACHRTASEGIGQAALVSAGAGVGKTFLVQALRNRCVEGTPWLEVRCRAYERHRALRPIAALLHQVLDLVVDPSLGTREERIETWVEVLDLPSDVFRPALMSLVGSSVQRCRLEVDAVELQRLETVATEVLFEALERLGRRRAPVLIFEDLQWADGATWTVLDRLIEEAEEMPLLLIATLRPKWSVHRSADLPKTRIHLDPLSKQDALTLAKDILGSAEHDQDRALSVAKRSEGVPLFVEALARAKLGSGEVPPKLMDLLAAQLDRLGSAKQLAHLASVLGRRFTLRELAGFSSFEGIMLDHEFERLVDAEVFARDPAHEGTWTFRSPLLRDAARSSWLDGDRKPPHRGTVI